MGFPVVRVGVNSKFKNKNPYFNAEIKNVKLDEIDNFDAFLLRVKVGASNKFEIVGLKERGGGAVVWKRIAKNKKEIACLVEVDGTGDFDFDVEVFDGNKRSCLAFGGPPAGSVRCFSLIGATSTAFPNPRPKVKVPTSLD